MPIQPSRYKHLSPTSCKEAIDKWPERYTWPSHEELSQLAQEDFVKITFLDKVVWARLPAQLCCFQSQCCSSCMDQRCCDSASATCSMIVSSQECLGEDHLAQLSPCMA